MRSFALWACLLAASLEARSQPRARPQPTEAEVKAAFLYHFAQLVTWPEPGEGEVVPPILLVILGPDPFGDKLEGTIGDETIRGRSLKILRAPTLAEVPASPHILFIGFTDRAEVDRGLSAVAKAPVLTVSSLGGFARQGGMIEFRLTMDRRVAFDINAQVVAAHGLKMSSQLLKIARIVESPR